MKSAIALLLAFVIGAVCRWLEIPVPSPPKLLGAVLVLATTVGYIAADRVLPASGGTAKSIAGSAGTQRR